MTVEVDKEKCTGCGICVESCALNAIKIEDGKAVISEECVECGACINQCPAEAIFFPV